MSNDEQALHSVVREVLEQGALQKAVLSKPARKTSGQASRMDLRMIQVKGQSLVQLTERIGNQDHHQNLTLSEACDRLLESVPALFLDVYLKTNSAEHTARYSRKGVCRFRTKQLSEPADPTGQEDHNRTRNYLIPDGVPCPFLIATGVMTPEGRVRAKHYRKFRQINRYVEIVKDIVNELPKDDVIRIVDFGCGKSYLTFATHHLLTKILHRRVDIRGLDQRPDVVATCQAIVEDLKLGDLTFQQSLISDYSPDSHVHMVISLHACDTATDDALANAVRWKSEVILAVPCCQHELAASLDRTAEPLFSDFGILHERFASLATDALRAQWLRAVGYDTTVMEFIDMQHTAKNLLIKAVRSSGASKPEQQKKALRQISVFQERLQISPLQLERQLGEQHEI